MGNERNGFSLIELLIVVAIILIIASISIPDLLRSKMSANEVSAVSSLRALNTACVTYYASYSDILRRSAFWVEKAHLRLRPRHLPS